MKNDKPNKLTATQVKQAKTHYDKAKAFESAALKKAAKDNLKALASYTDMGKELLNLKDKHKGNTTEFGKALAAHGIELNKNEQAAIMRQARFENDPADANGFDLIAAVNGLDGRSASNYGNFNSLYTAWNKYKPKTEKKPGNGDGEKKQGDGESQEKTNATRNLTLTEQIDEFLKERPLTEIEKIYTLIGDKIDIMKNNIRQKS